MVFDLWNIIKRVAIKERQKRSLKRNLKRKDMYEYKVKLKRVVDADTFDFQVDLGFKILINFRFRLRDIDCPEIYRPKNDAELKHGKEAVEFVKKELSSTSNIVIKSYKLGIYGRYDADVFYDDKNLKDELIKNGFEKKDSYE